MRIPLIEVDEIDALSHLLRISPEFERFYKEERLKKVGLIRWYKDLSLDKYTLAQAGIFEYTIHFRGNLTSYAHVIAHEILHIIRSQENPVCLIKSKSQYS